ncbi:MAG: UDP-N-acetylmuramoyl-tripeptide--D-alanyl-D-alanine ligase [Acutalibacteraceae bacterium]
MFDTVIMILRYVMFYLMYAFVLIDTMHFFQLNSYKPVTQLRWLKKNPDKIVYPVCAAVVSLIINYLIHGNGSPAAYAIVLLFVIPKKAKKPLVYTPRVRRMLLTSAAVTVIPMVLIHALTGSATALVVTQSVYAALSPFMVMIANFINKPIEKRINNGYINDAKRILASCPELKIIGVTGSYGKTSVKYYLHTLLQAKYNVLMTPESYNTPMGVVKTIRGSLKSTDEFFICEMGARWVGDIKELCDIVHPQHGIITSIGPQHLESFGSLENVVKTKFELADSLPEGGYLFLNGDDENIKAHETNRPCIRYTVEGDGDYNATDISVSSKGTSFTVTAPTGETERFSTKIIGRHNVLNIVGAIAVAHTFGVPMKMLKGQVRKLEGVPHRLELINRNGITLIDDAYNSNPAGSKAALDALSLFDGFKIAVTPGMVELGEKQEELNREFGRQMARVCDYVILVGKRQAPPMLEGLREMAYGEDRIFVADTVQEAFAHAYSINSKGKDKVILIENDLPDNY